MSSRQPTPRRHHVAIGVGQKLYIWGGEGDLLRIHPTSVQTFNVVLGTWERPQQLHGSLPDSLYDVAYTSDGHIAYFFGGREGFLYNDALYEIDLSTLNSRQLVPANPSCAPKITSGSRMVYYSQQLVHYGGSRGHHQHDGLHVLDLKTNEWRVQSTTGNKPPPLASHTFTKVDHHRAVIFGGFTGQAELNDSYVLDMETWNWTKLDISGAKPLVRNCHAACCIAGPLTGQKHPILMVVGGWHTDSSTLGDVWLLGVDEAVWREVTLPESITPRRCHSVNVFGSESSFRTVVLFGGYKFKGFSEIRGCGGYLSETTLLLLGVKSLYHSCVDYVAERYELYQPLLQQLLPPHIHTDIRQEREKRANRAHFRVVQL